MPTLSLFRRIFPTFNWEKVQQISIRKKCSPVNLSLNLLNLFVNLPKFIVCIIKVAECQLSEGINLHLRNIIISGRHNFIYISGLGLHYENQFTLQFTHHILKCRFINLHLMRNIIISGRHNSIATLHKRSWFGIGLNRNNDTNTEKSGIQIQREAEYKYICAT